MTYKFSIYLVSEYSAVSSTTVCNDQDSTDVNDKVRMIKPMIVYAMSSPGTLEFQKTEHSSAFEETIEQKSMMYQSTAHMSSVRHITEQTSMSHQEIAHFSSFSSQIEEATTMAHQAIADATNMAQQAIAEAMAMAQQAIGDKTTAVSKLNLLPSTTEKSS